MPCALPMELSRVQPVACSLGLPRRGKGLFSCCTYKLDLPEAVYTCPGHQALRMEVNDTVLIKKLQMRDEAAFEEAFKQNYKSLHAYAFTILRDEVVAEEM